jgi:hypothetical protein
VAEGRVRVSRQAVPPRRSPKRGARLSRAAADNGFQNALLLKAVALRWSCQDAPVAVAQGHYRIP